MYDILFALTLIFVLAAVLLVVAAQASLPVVPFYLLAGVLAGVAIDEAQLLDLTQWGIAFLIFLFGVHFDLEALGSRGRISTTAALTQAATIGVISYSAGLLFGLDSLNAVYFAVAATLSSSLVATSYLDTADGARPTFTRLAESIHFTEDILGVLIVLALSALVYSGSPAVTQFAVAAGMVAAALGIRYLFFHRLTARLQGDSEVMMLIGISFVIGFIALSELFGLSIVVGAFAAGIAIADDYPHSLELVDTVDDLEDFFSPIFFVTVGALLTVPGPLTVGYTFALVAAVLVLNPLVVAVVLLRGGFDGRTAVLTGLTLDQVSVFSLFIAIEALAEGAIDRAVFDAIVLAAVITLFAATYTSRHCEQINQWVRDWGFVRLLGKPPADRSQIRDDLVDHVIIVDFEQTSHPLIEACSAVDRPVVVIEDNPVRLADLEQRCQNYIYGDVLDDRLWELAQVEQAALVISLTPEYDRTKRVVELDEDTSRLVRVDDAETAREFLEYENVGVFDPYAISGERLTDELQALLADEISVEEFSDPETGRSQND